MLDALSPIGAPQSSPLVPSSTISWSCAACRHRHLCRNEIDFLPRGGPRQHNRSSLPIKAGKSPTDFTNPVSVPWLIPLLSALSSPPQPSGTFFASSACSPSVLPDGRLPSPPKDGCVPNRATSWSCAHSDLLRFTTQIIFVFPRLSHQTGSVQHDDLISRRHRSERSDHCPTLP